jgi:hypothetical protein
MNSARVAAILRAQARALILIAEELEREALPVAEAPRVDEVTKKRAENILRRKGLWRE